MEAKERPKGKDHIILTVNTLRWVWKSRNQIQFNSERKCSGMIVNKAMHEWIEHHKAHQEEAGEGKEKNEDIRVEIESQPPQEGIIKLNIDVAVDIKKKRQSWMGNSS